MNASPRRLYITGTDTDVGKTRVSAAVAKAAMQANGGVAGAMVVKIVQTGLAGGVPGDAQTAARLAGCRALELHRFEKPADPWTAALHAREQPLQAQTLAAQICKLQGCIVAEGSGGAAVPLNPTQSVSEVARLCDLETILVVGLRLGCINHALLSIEYLCARSIPLLGAILCERWPLADPGYPREVESILREHCRVFGIAAFEPDGALSTARTANLFTSLFAAP